MVLDTNEKWYEIISVAPTGAAGCWQEAQRAENKKMYASDYSDLLMCVMY